MRSLVLIFITLAVLLLGFLIYEFVQPSLAPLNNEPYQAAVAPQPVSSANHMGIGPGEGVWIERHDPNTGRMSERFKGTHYDWNTDGTMKVASPQAEFFLDQGRIMRINGRTGDVVVEQGGPPGKSGGITMNQPAAPSRGNMKDVTIRLFESASAPKPMLIVTMNNATFDTQINRIYTESAVIDGKTIPADRIPVHMRGEDEDFDGFGLQIRWDQKQSKLQLLQIDHGQRLLIKHPNAGEKSAHPAVKSPPPKNPAALPLQRQGSSPNPAPPTPPEIQIYRASFQNNVYVTQAGAELAKADEMQVDFASAENSDHSSSPSPGTPASGEQSRTAEGGGDSSFILHPSSLPSSRSESKPTTRSDALGNEPILITWTGKLVVTPFNETGPLHADPHGQVITFLGQPAIVRQKGTQVVATDLAYGAPQEELIAHGTPAAPVIMTSNDGARVVTQTIDYLRHDNRATLTGAGSVTRPLKSTNQTPQSMTAQWARSCRLTFFGSDEHDLSIHTADLDGAVKINHPQVKLNADQLSIAFAAPVGNQQPDLDHLHSTGSVDAVVRDAHGKSQAIQCQSLDLSTAATNTALPLQPVASAVESRQASHAPARFISRLLADGNVLAHDPESEIRAQHLDAHLIPAPTTQPTSDQPLAAVQLEHLIAQTDVHVRGKNNATADADDLDVTMQSGQASTVILKGRPAVAQKGQDITKANLIELHPKAEIYDIPAAGTMHLARQSENNSPPTDVWWQSGLHADLNKNTIDIDRGVIVKTTSTNQAHNTATSDHLQIILEDKPHAGSAGGEHRRTEVLRRPGLTPKTNSDSLFGDASNTDLAGQKQAKSLTMLGHVRVQSVRGDDTGHLLQQFNLESTRLDYAIPQQTMTCPQAGKIFFYDNNRKAAATKPANGAPDVHPGLGGPAVNPEPNNPLAGGDRRGRTAIKYDEKLIYNQATGRIELHKNVYMLHEPLDKTQSPTELRSQHMVVDLLKSGDKTTPDQMSIAHLVATDQVMFTTKTLQCQASKIDYTPATGIFIITGQPYSPAIMYDEQGASKGTFDTLYYNSKTEQIERMDGFHSNVRRGPEVPTKLLVPPSQ